MRRTSLSIPEIAIIAGTRGMLGAGVGLLLANRLSSEQRRAVGWTLFAIGALSTIPIGVQLFQSLSEDEGYGRVREFADPEYVTP
jgi:hypothetical protein